MSTIVTSNVSDGTLSIPTTYVTNGSAKAWVNFDGTGTIAARDSLNLSSLTDRGTGQYTTTFTNSFAATGYCVHFSGGDVTYISSAAVYYLGTQATSNQQLNTYNFSTGSSQDMPTCCAQMHGDLA
jgi:hypothetical protein